MFCLSDYTLNMDAPELFTLKAPLPFHHRLAWKTHLGLPKDHPVVFISPGSSGNLAYFQGDMKCLQHMGVAIIVATAGQLSTRTNIKKHWFDLFMTCSFTALLIKHRYSKVACIVFVIELTTQVCFFSFFRQGISVAVSPGAAAKQDKSIDVVESVKKDR